jgi:hypothetical protein
MTKLNEQCKLLKASPATMKQKIHMTDSVIRTGIAYGSYIVAYSMPTINKLDKILIRLQKSICGMPKSTPDILTQLPQNMFGLEAFSLRNAYLRCISENLRNALNDIGRLGVITSLQKMAEHKTFPESSNKHVSDPLLPTQFFF